MTTWIQINPAKGGWIARVKNEEKGLDETTRVHLSRAGLFGSLCAILELHEADAKREASQCQPNE